MSQEQEDDRVYIVLINTEGQYSLWLKEKDIPRGWHFAEKEGSRSECANYVDAVWTDMRPMSLRGRMEIS